MTSKLWSKVAGVITGFCLVDTLAWLFTGQGLGQLVSDHNAPLIESIASEVGVLPTWAFYGVSCAAVVVLAVLFCACVESSSSTPYMGHHFKMHRGAKI